MSKIIRRGKLFYKDKLGDAIKEFAAIAHKDFVKNNWKWGKSIGELFKTGKDKYYTPSITELEAHLLGLYVDHMVSNTDFGVESGRLRIKPEGGGYFRFCVVV